MKRTLGTVLVVFVLAALAIAGWLLVYVQQTRSATDRAVERISDPTEVTIDFIVDAPEGTPPDQPLYLSGSSPRLGNWDPAGVRMERGEDGRYHRAVKLLRNMAYDYKVTRGTWSTVERTADDQEMPNRSIQPLADGDVELHVGTWTDKGLSIPGRITLTGDVRLHKLFPSEKLGNERTLIVLLPAGYSQATDRRYPVLYLNDGQNLMDESTSFNGVEWQVDETVNALIAEGRLEPMIVVGVYNTPDREAEFTPGEGEAARGDAYAAFLADEVKPFIDEMYRTMADRDHAAVGGGGLGAVIALRTVMLRGEAFGLCLAFNPWDWGGEPTMLSDWKAHAEDLRQTRFAIDTADLAERLEAAGVPPDHVKLIAAPPDANREADWAERFGDAVLFLFGDRG